MSTDNARYALTMLYRAAFLDLEAKAATRPV